MKNSMNYELGIRNYELYLPQSGGERLYYSLQFLEGLNVKILQRKLEGRAAQASPTSPKGVKSNNRLTCFSAFVEKLLRDPTDPNSH